MDELQFLMAQAIEAARNRDAQLASLTLAGGGPWVKRAAQRLLSQAGLMGVKVSLIDPTGPVRLVSYEFNRPARQSA